MNSAFCRLCLKRLTGNVASVDVVKLPELALEIENFLGISIRPSDQCSRRICSECIGIITDAVSYKHRVLYNQENLKKQIEFRSKLQTLKSEDEEDDDVILVTEDPPNVVSSTQRNFARKSTTTCTYETLDAKRRRLCPYRLKVALRQPTEEDVCNVFLDKSTKEIIKLNGKRKATEKKEKITQSRTAVAGKVYVAAQLNTGTSLKIASVASLSQNGSTPPERVILSKPSSSVPMQQIRPQMSSASTNKCHTTVVHAKPQMTAGTPNNTTATVVHSIQPTSSVPVEQIRSQMIFAMPNNAIATVVHVKPPTVSVPVQQIRSQVPSAMSSNITATFLHAKPTAPSVPVQQIRSQMTSAMSSNTTATFVHARPQTPSVPVQSIRPQSSYAKPHLSQIRCARTLPISMSPLPTCSTNSATVSSVPTSSLIRFRPPKMISPVTPSATSCHQTSVQNINNLHVLPNNHTNFKILTVNELNTRSLTATESESRELNTRGAMSAMHSRRLPMSMVITKLRNEMEIKLKDVMGNDVSWSSLIPIEKRAVRNSILEKTMLKKFNEALLLSSPGAEVLNLFKLLNINFNGKQIVT